MSRTYKYTGAGAGTFTLGCCCLSIFLVFWRQAIFLYFFFTTNWFSTVWDNWFFPLLGFMAMPLTTLAFTGFTANNADFSSPTVWLSMGLVILFDIMSWFGSISSAKKST